MPTAPLAQAYNPLAAGMLTGKHTQDGEVLTGRFKENPNYLNRFYTKETFAALDVIKDACDKHAMSMTQATYSWMLCVACPPSCVAGAAGSRFGG